jgi:hypothetical protein
MKNGIIELDGGVRIGAHTTRSALLAAYPSTSVVVENGQNRTYRLGPVSVRNRRVFISVIFFDEVLRQVIMADAKDGMAAWSEELSEHQLQADKDKNDKWLASEYGIVTDLLTAPWGRLESLADKKTGCAIIVLSFV